MRTGIFAATLAIGLSLAAVAQQAPFIRPSDNIAFGKPYTMTPAPSYKFCLDAGDATQLTDGAYVDGYFWTMEGTVGWRSAGAAVVTIDLGQDEPIRGASFNTAAGTAGVEWPLAVYVMVAGEDKQFYRVGDLVSLSAERGLPKADTYSVHRYWTDALKTHGRYVAFIFEASPYAFCDEIEVYQGEQDWLELPYSGEPISDIQAYIAAMSVRDGIRRRVNLDVQAVTELANADGVLATVRDAVVAELQDVAAQVESIDVPDDAFRAVLPVNDLHARVFKARARLWQAAGLAPLVAWQSPLWGPLGHLQDPDTSVAPSVDVFLMQNEYRAGAFNLTNTGSEDLDVAIGTEGLPGSAGETWLTVHEVAWTDTRGGVPVAAALPEANVVNANWEVSIPAGMTRQIWLTFHPDAVDAGAYDGRIIVQGGAGTFEIPLTLQIYPFRFPDQPTLHFGGWDYTETDGVYGETPENRDALLAHLREHFVDSPWARSIVMPFGKYDDQTNMTEDPDTGAFDQWLERWPDARQYCVFLSVGDTCAGRQMGTPEFDKAVAQWITFWADYAKSKGIDPGQIPLLLVDEPHEQEQDAVILAWAKAIHAADTGVLVWEDPTYSDMSEAMPEMIAECDVLCPNRQIFMGANQAYRDYYIARRDAGTTLEFYSCSGPVRMLDPYAYHRLQAWTCWEFEATAGYFWAFTDNAGVSAWNEYLAPRNAYSPLFLDPASVTAGKHMEACREGIEDYEYFVMLRSAVEQCRASGKAGSEIEHAERLLNELAGQVAWTIDPPTFYWSAEIDRSEADAARRQLVEALVALTK